MTIARYTDLQLDALRELANIGSIGKDFTKVAIEQLAAAGKLSLDDTVERWVPGLVPGGAYPM